MPKISVIVPVYNVEKYLRRCLESIKNQTFTDWQAICVNDGSPDNSAQILQEFANADARFVIVNKENGGLSDARNVGMQYATGDYVLFVDSDDFIHPQTLEIAYSLALQNETDIVSFTYDRIYRPQLMIRHKLKLDTDNVVPKRFYKKYDIEKIKTRTTDDVFEYATERTHNKFNPNRRWLIKHCLFCRLAHRKSAEKNITESAEKATADRGARENIPLRSMFSLVPLSPKPINSWKFMLHHLLITKTKAEVHIFQSQRHRILIYSN